MYKELKSAKICNKVRPLIRKFVSAAARLSRPQPVVTQQEPLAFMTCIIKVDTRSRGWQQAVSRVMRSSQVRNFKMDKEGIVEVCGVVNPKKLLKALGKGRKRAKLCWFQFGECSSNLLGPPAAAPAPKKNDPLEFSYLPTAIGYDKFNGYGSYPYPYPPQLFMS
ncbi:unnamed protein product [Fraxinus pennsylvanica]|uniref:Uncharacterized protein n=1 Tax=Fraxinus pennsylvanica TaxID=56036 RepID=A0AAD2E6A7_9LAMI|nr:unnamed protein product [Fraxinus pennsylvanica]